MAMLCDAAAFDSAGVAGIVTGVLTEEGTIDQARCRQLLSMTGELQKVCHRCFDVVPDPFEALETLIDLGFSRILTSGQRAHCIDGIGLIKRLIEKADGRIEILPGGGLTAAEIPRLITETGCDQVHLASFESAQDRSTLGNPEIRYAGISMAEEAHYGRINSGEIQKIVRVASEID